MVYDKAKYHFDSCEENGLPIEQAFIHTGLFVAWLANHNLLDPSVVADSAAAVSALKARELTGPQFFEQECDGCLVDDMLTDEGNAFAAGYFDFENGSYLKDYEEVLTQDLPSIFHVPDTWESYDRIAIRIDERYAGFRVGSRG